MDNPTYKSFLEESEESTNKFSQEENIIPIAVTPPPSNRVRLRAVATEAEYYLPLLNVTAIKWLIVIQIISSVLIFTLQILCYAIPNIRYFAKISDHIGIGIWGPLLFFNVAIIVSKLACKNATGAWIGAALGMQIMAIVVSVLLIFTETISILEHGYYDHDNQTFNKEALGKAFSNIILIGGAGMFISAFFVSVFFCQAVCCGRKRILDRVQRYDVERVDVGLKT